MKKIIAINGKSCINYYNDIMKKIVNVFNFLKTESYLNFILKNITWYYMLWQQLEERWKI